MRKIKIKIIDFNNQQHTIHTSLDSDLNLMDVVKEAGFEIGNCGGMALCASCHCSIENNKHLNKKSIEEEGMLDQLHNSHSNSRLMCQIPLSKELDGLRLRMIRD